MHFAAGLFMLSQSTASRRLSLIRELITSNQFEDAIHLLREELKERPGNIKARSNYAACLLAIGRADEAIEAATIEQFKEGQHDPGLTVLAEAFQFLGQPRKAVSALCQVSRLDQFQQRAVWEFCKRHSDKHLREHALKLLATIRARFANSPAAFRLSVRYLEGIGLTRQALSVAEAFQSRFALTKEDNLLLARLYLQAGKYEQTISTLTELFDETAPWSPLLDQVLTTMIYAAARSNLPAVLNTHLGQLETLRRQVQQSQERNTVVCRARAIQSLSLEWPRILKQNAKTQSPETPRDTPIIFQIGFPRSGTTLLETFLLSTGYFYSTQEDGYLFSLLLEHYPAEELEPGFRIHPETAMNVAEMYTDHLSDIKKHTHGKTVVEKLPLLTIEAPLIKAIFPRAKFIFCLRDPREVVLSCFCQTYSPNDAMENFATLESTLLFYDQVMSIWANIRANLEADTMYVRHETLVSAPEATLRNIIQFVSPDLAREINISSLTTDNRGWINTPSYWQVRQPLRTQPSWAAAYDMIPSDSPLSDWISFWNY